MALLSWILFSSITLCLGLVILFLFYILLPSISQNDEANPIFSSSELSPLVPKENQLNINSMRAIVLCSPDKTFSKPEAKFNPDHSCLLINLVYSSGNDCKFSCIGQGDCVKICPQNAIEIINHTAVVTDLCVGCGKCIPACPKKIIKLIPKSSTTQIVCNNTERSLTSCTKLRNEEKITIKAKKGFKIWEKWYRIIK